MKVIKDGMCFIFEEENNSFYITTLDYKKNLFLEFELSKKEIENLFYDIGAILQKMKEEEKEEK